MQHIHGVCSSLSASYSEETTTERAVTDHVQRPRLDAHPFEEAVRDDKTLPAAKATQTGT